MNDSPINTQAIAQTSVQASVAADLDFDDSDVTLPGFTLDVERGADAEHVDAKGWIS